MNASARVPALGGADGDGVNVCDGFTPCLVVEAPVDVHMRTCKGLKRELAICHALKPLAGSSQHEGQPTDALRVVDCARPVSFPLHRKLTVQRQTLP